MSEFQKTEQVHVVPKADIDRMFTETYRYLKPSSEIAKKMRGIAYANTFFATRRTIIVKPD